MYAYACVYVCKQPLLTNLSIPEKWTHDSKKLNSTKILWNCGWEKSLVRLDTLPLPPPSNNHNKIWMRSKGALVWLFHFCLCCCSEGNYPQRDFFTLACLGIKLGKVYVYFNLFMNKSTRRKLCKGAENSTKSGILKIIFPPSTMLKIKTIHNFISTKLIILLILN